MRWRKSAASVRGSSVPSPHASQGRLTGHLPRCSTSLAHHSRARGLSSQRICWFSSRTPTRTQAASSIVQTEDSRVFESNPLRLRSHNVREYFKQWSVDHQRQLRDNAPSDPSHDRIVTLPNSFFARDDSALPGILDEEEPQGHGSLDSENGTSGYHDDFDGARHFLNPGDLILVAGRGVHRQFAVYLHTVGFQAQYLLADGRWFVTTQFLSSAHCIEGFATTSEVAAIKPHLPIKAVEDVTQGSSISTTGEVPHEVSRPLLSKIARLTEKCEQYKREYAGLTDNVFDALALEDQCARATIDEALQKCGGNGWDSIEDAARFVVIDKFGSDDRFALRPIGRYWTVEILAKAITKAVTAVTQWTRQYQDAAAQAASGKEVGKILLRNPLTKFITKARRLISKSRKIRSPTVDGRLGPTVKSACLPSGEMERRPTGEVFDEDDRQIILFLAATYCFEPFCQIAANARKRASGSLILRAVGAYPNYSLGDATASLLLQELGCLDPWFNRKDFSLISPLPAIGLSAPMAVAQQNRDAALKQAKADPESTGLILVDTMSHLRKDWGDLEVYCVDSASTRVVDDGISVEPSQMHRGAWWIHVHIAHLSAYLPFDSPLHDMARLMGGSYYDHRGSVPCYPYEVTDAYGVQSGGAVLTCSTLLDPNGAVLDIKITPGTVHNVIRIDSAQLQQYLGVPPPTYNFLAVGSPPTNDMPEKFCVKHSKPFQPPAIFRTLEEMMHKRIEARNRENPHSLHLRRSLVTLGELHVGNLGQEDNNWRRIFKSEHCFGDPYIAVGESKPIYGVAPDEPRLNESVTENGADPIAFCMILAAESAGKWAADRGIPMIYRSEVPSPGYDIARLNNLGFHESYGSITSVELTRPERRLTNNLAQEVAFTNPLRRFRDMMTHQQIDAYLKAQNTDQPSINLSQEQHIDFPFSEQQMMEEIRRADANRVTRVIARRVGEHWKLMALFRAFHFNEAKLPDVWDVQIGNFVNLRAPENGTGNTRGTLMGVMLPATVHPSDAGWERTGKFRQYLPVKLMRINYDSLRVECVAVGPASDTPTVEDFAYSELRPRFD